MVPAKRAAKTTKKFIARADRIYQKIPLCELRIARICSKVMELDSRMLSLLVHLGYQLDGQEAFYILATHIKLGIHVHSSG